MSYEPFPFDTFGRGLNLRAKVDAVQPGEAIDCLNVVYTERGAVKQRDGYAAFTSSALTNRAASLFPFYRYAAASQLVAGCGTRLEALNTSGAVVSSATGLTDAVWDAARFAAPGSEYVYIGNANDTIRRWDGAAWTAPANMPKAGALAVQASDNRLVAGKFDVTTGGPTGGASTSNPSRVYFSDPGAPETFGTNNYIDLSPGDGEGIQAIVAFREFVVAFKQSKFFVFTGTSTDSTGNPIFNVRAVDTGVGLASPRAVAVSRQGIHFLDRTGVYVTTGQEPTLISDAITPIFDGDSSSFYLGGELAQGSIANCAATWHDEKLWLSFPTSSAADRTLVYDPRFDAWAITDLPAAALASFRISSAPELVFAYAAGTKDIGRHSSSYTNDAGTAITSRWRSGWPDLGQVSEKVIRETWLWGSGVVSVGVATDFAQGAGYLSVVDMRDTSTSTWGGSTWGGTTWAQPAGLIQGFYQESVQGTTFSLSLSNSTLDQSWSVERAEYHVRTTEPAGLAE